MCAHWCPRRIQLPCAWPVIRVRVGTIPFHRRRPLGMVPTSGRPHTQPRAGGRRRVWPPSHRGNLKFKEDAISPSWVQMRSRSITQDFQKMIHELEELWCGIFEGRGEVVNSPLLIVSKQVFPWLQPGSIRAGKIFPFQMIGKKTF